MSATADKPPDVDEGLVNLLRQAADRWGSLGVVTVACELAGIDAPGRGRPPLTGEVREARIIDVIEVTSLTGLGTQESRARQVTDWYLTDGTLIGHHDPAAD